MMRHLNAIVAATTVAVLLSSCKSVRPFDPSGVKVSVDSAVYHLQPGAGNYWYEINLTVTVVNDAGLDVYVSRECGSWHLGRADESDKTYLYLGSYACIEGARQAPLTLTPGEGFSRSFRLTGSNSPQTRPPITMENNTGTLVFTYWLADPDGNILGRARSSPFRVEPPA